MFSRREAVANDEIFVLILVSICLTIVVVMSFRSRRGSTVLATAEPAVTPEAPIAPEEQLEPAERPRRRKRR
jgi:hypothetical protein